MHRSRILCSANLTKFGKTKEWIWCWSCHLNIYWMSLKKCNAIQSFAVLISMIFLYLVSIMHCTKHELRWHCIWRQHCGKYFLFGLSLHFWSRNSVPQNKNWSKQEIHVDAAFYRDSFAERKKQYIIERNIDLGW